MIVRAIFFSLLILLNTSTWAAPPPPDFASMQDVKQKKAAFFNYLYPLILQENKKILADRKTLTSPTTSQAELIALCQRYSKNCGNRVSAKQRQALLKKIAVVPPSLALAQAANESAWGTSRFARQARNYFGQWCFTQGCGLVPSRRDPGAAHEVRKFSNVQESVAAYLFNLNTGRAYEKMRDIRARAINRGEQPSGYELAGGLSQYSQRGQDYVDEIRSMISFNKLVEKYDQPFWSALAP